MAARVGVVKAAAAAAALVLALVATAVTAAGPRVYLAAGLTQCVTGCGSKVTSCMLGCYGGGGGGGGGAAMPCLLGCTNDALFCATGCSDASL
ncbi:hypothetical protein GUJ93_ZPchr0001g31601 [Zizania palustris]|uniref:Uncharacterized protein n=1 Tax=Zizania palustris TaxID=103762 RepID=A0A8J5RPG8_ZIZPA|nr:hypothetical protein GUJ93_ZPchr0001g31601 [Zizania palustris]